MTKGACFDYAGNAQADLPIWARARRAIIVNPHRGVTEAVRKRCTIERVFDDRPPAWRTWYQQMRLYQWSKNLLVGVPLLTAHAFDLRSISAVLVAFLVFGCVASGAYLLNDLIDLPSDRRHPRKCRRPFAAGDLSLSAGLVVMLVLLGAGFIVAALRSPSLLLILLAYLALTFSYSLHLKSIVLLDVLVLAALYTVRIIAGAVAIQVEMSSWLMAFSMFIFLSLALVKRSSELMALKGVSRSAAINRDYHDSDYDIVTAMGVTAGYLSVVVLALYVDSPLGQAKYTRPGLLWLLCPVMLYWISRLWIKTARGEMQDDPLMFSLRDRTSWMVIAVMVLVMLAAM
jgi:4-hydroxybenzoate polyprenyltransferase